MSFDFSTLVTDRTQADVSRVKQIAEKIKNGTASESELAEFNSAAMKGAYNYTDLNRVTAAMEALKSKLEGYGYSVPGYQRIKVPHVLPEPEPTGRLPEGYTELTYIESSGTQYINSGFKANNNTRVVIDFEYISGDVVFGAYDTNGSNGFGLQAASNKWYVYYGSSGGYSSTALVKNTRLVADINKNVATLNGNALLTSTVNSFSGANPLIISGLYNASSPGFLTALKIYSCQIYDNGTLVRDYVPCTNASGAVGLYDMVNSKFYANAGSGTFAAGEEVVAPATASVAVVSDAATEYDPHTWYEFDWPTPETMTIYLLNVVALRSVFAVMASTPNVSSDMVNLMVNEANNIEKILVDINELLMKSTQAWFYSGELFAGEV